MQLTMTQGSSAPAMYVIPSCFRLMPGEEEEVMARMPAPAAPYTMLMAATSDSDCRNTPPALGRWADIYSGTSLWGVMG